MSDETVKRTRGGVGGGAFGFDSSCLGPGLWVGNAPGREALRHLNETRTQPPSSQATVGRFPTAFFF